MVVAENSCPTHDYLEERKKHSQNRSPRKRRVKVKKLQLLSCIMVFFLLGISLTALTAVQAVKGNEINQLKEDIENIRISNDQLYREKTKLEALSRIEKIATTELGMKKPKIERVEMLTGESAEKINDLIYNQKTKGLTNDVGKSVNTATEDTANVNPYIEIISNLISNWLTK